MWFNLDGFAVARSRQQSVFVFLRVFRGSEPFLTALAAA
jgi:hypothetical protein